ncbi:MAG: hypothetical protein ACI4L6_00380 [Candidatus Onthoplasma sp.]
MLNLNPKFLSQMKSLLGDEYDDFVHSLNQPCEKAIFVNENKIPVEQFKKIVDFDIEQIPYERCGFYVDNSKKGKHPLHHAGAFYVQEPAAMFTVNSNPFKGDEKVLDMCASPGGKTIQIANRVPSGVVVSNEFNKKRSEILFSNVERMGLKNVIITNDNPENISECYPNCFDVCLVDAPCSGEGMFRKGEDMVDNWNENLSEMCARRQIQILDCADNTLKVGGHLIYSTCTYSKLENEDVINEFMLTHNYQLEYINADFNRGIDMPQAVRLYPHKQKGEGQFVAVLKKVGAKDFYGHGQKLKLKSDDIAKNFIKENMGINLMATEYNHDSFYVADEDLIRKGVNYVSLGVKLGTKEKNRFVPFHNLFTAFGEQFKNKINLGLSDEKVKKYLKGETFEVDLTDGFGCLMVENCALGGFKVSQGMFKNLYPKGLRNQT